MFQPKIYNENKEQFFLLPLQHFHHHDHHLQSVHDHPSPAEEYSRVVHRVQIDSPAFQLLSEAE